MQNESAFPSSSANGSSNGLKSASADAHNFLADIEGLVTSTTSLTAEDLTRAKARIAAGYASARQSVVDMSGAVAERARETVKATDVYVREQPWRAVGISAALGVLIGFVLARR